MKAAAGPTWPPRLPDPAILRGDQHGQPRHALRQCSVRLRALHHQRGAQAVDGTRRTALAALLLGSAGVAAWHWHVAHYTRGRTAENIVARYVSDTDTGAWLDAQVAVYGAGSSLMGPMRADNLPAFSDQGAVGRFVPLRGGRVVPFSAINAPLLRGMVPRLRADHRLHSG